MLKNYVENNSIHANGMRAICTNLKYLPKLMELSLGKVACIVNII